MTEEELKAIEGRREKAWHGWVEDLGGELEQQLILRQDVPALIAEVRRLIRSQLHSPTQGPAMDPADNEAGQKAKS